MKKVGMPPLFRQLAVGILPLAPLESISSLIHLRSAFGKLGVMLLVVESGMQVDVVSLKKFGIRAFFAALVGVLIPVALVPFSSPSFWGDCPLLR